MAGIGSRGRFAGVTTVAAATRGNIRIKFDLGYNNLKPGKNAVLLECCHTRRVGPSCIRSVDIRSVSHAACAQATGRADLRKIKPGCYR